MRRRFGGFETFHTPFDPVEPIFTARLVPPARGGASSADLVLSEDPIAYPFVQRPDYLVVLSQEAYTKFRPTARREEEVFIDDDLVNPANIARQKKLLGQLVGSVLSD